MNPGSPNKLMNYLPALLAGVGCFYFLFLWFPYSFGYGSVQVSIFTMCVALWHDYGDWEHGFLVFPIAIWLVWLRRKNLAKIPWQGSGWGLAGMAFTLFMFWVGFRTDVHYFGFISVQMFVGALIIWFFGWEMFRALFFPWAFLVFAWPFLFLESFIAFPLRMLMSEISFHVLNLIGLDTVRVGSAVVSTADPSAGLEQGERFAVDIADPCSGIRSLFALTMVAAVYGYLMLKKWWQIVLIILLAIPLAVVGNFARILMLTFGTLAFGSEFAIGSIDDPSGFHMAAGFVVFAVALVGMVAIAGALVKIPVWIDRARKGDWKKEEKVSKIDEY